MCSSRAQDSGICAGKTKLLQVLSWCNLATVERGHSRSPHFADMAAILCIESSQCSPFARLLRRDTAQPERPEIKDYQLFGNSESESVESDFAERVIARNYQVEEYF